MKFDHVANRVAAPHFEVVVAMFTTQLGFREMRRTERSIWLRQPGANIDLQFSRTTTAPHTDDKARSQVSFLSETPQADLQALADWAAGQGLTAGVGAYSDREFYLDAPDAFIDFVVEAMLPELADYGPQNAVRS